MIRWWLFPILFMLFGGCPSPERPQVRQISRASLLPLAGQRTTPDDLRPSPFPYGVASGDPLPDAVILWSMLDTAAARQDSLVKWQISEEADFAHIHASGTVTTKADRRYSIKVDVRGLQENTSYYYRFKHHLGWSSTGRTRTAPAPDQQLEAITLAVVSCNALEWGHMNAFGKIAERKDLTAVVHLGDYIYEYASGVYGDTSLGRFHEPRHEVVTAEDYHIRYAQYRREPQLRAAHEAHPFICVWDDHEVANDSHLYGAENHNSAEEGDYLTRMTAAKRVYYNWMPIREQASGAIYRRFRFGELVDLHMLDERLAGRKPPADSFAPHELADSSRRMLGEAQLQWLCRGLRESQTRWQLIGNQVLFARLDLKDILPEYAVNLDAWDGYAYEQGRLKDSLWAYGDFNTIFLTGDTHCSWYFDIEDTDGQRIAHELATPSVSSANYDELIGGWDTLAIARYRLYRDNEHLHYTNIKDHGYLSLELGANEAIARFHYSESIRYATRREKSLKTYQIPYVPVNHLQ
ncbi:alkaline phosphatase D family protein [Neolewinella agarilytica]|uniref:alkaline phosphatase D family protein n=1 Tax=Neolewinella agarilytica TaxID=478744 RepID=UPI0023575CBD|nr:alkaline phosphatase D family protein [Neolewinella agarilytica]